MRIVDPQQLDEFTLTTEVFPWAATATTRLERTIGFYQVGDREVRQTLVEEFESGVGLDNPLDYLADRDEKPGEFNTGSSGDFKVLRPAGPRERGTWKLFTLDDLLARDGDGDGAIRGDDLMGLYLHQGAEEIGLDAEGRHVLPAWLPFPLHCPVHVAGQGDQEAMERFLVQLESIDLQGRRAAWRIHDRRLLTAEQPRVGPD